MHQLRPILREGHTSDITLGVGWVVYEYNELILLSSLDVGGDIKPESEVPSSMKSSLFTLLIRSYRRHK